MESSLLDSCWICEGWQEQPFKWTPKISGNLKDAPLFLHVSLYKYQPLLMNFSDVFSLGVMCPPGVKVLYFFSNPMLGIHSVAYDQQIMDVAVDDPLYASQTYYYNGMLKVDGPTKQKVNYLEPSIKQQPVGSNYLPVVKSRPRMKHPPYIFDEKDKESNWKLETSIFANYRYNSDELIQQCFEFDFESSKINRLVKDDVKQVKELLSKYYPSIFHAYKFYVGQGVMNTVTIYYIKYNQLPSISVISALDLISKTSILDSKIKSSDIEVMLICCNGKDIQYPYVFEKAIVRYQLMEFLVRIAIDKYMK